MARVKGSAFSGLRAFVTEQGGAPTLARLRERLTSEDAAILDDAIAIGWYPLSAYLHVIDALGDALSIPAEDAARAYGRFAATYDLSTIHRLFMRFANPAYVLEKSAEYWARFYDTGTWRVRRDGETRAHAELHGFGALDPLFCDFLTAYTRRMFELVGARDARVVHPRCRAHHASPAEACVFLVTWR